MLRSLQKTAVKYFTNVARGLRCAPRVAGGVYALLTVAVGISGCSDMQPWPPADRQALGSGQTAEAATASPAPASTRNAVARVRVLPSLDPGDTKAEANRLRSTLQREVHGLLRPTQAQQRQWISMVRLMLKERGKEIRRAQLLVAVDRNPHVQALMLIVAQPGGPWMVLGGTHVSTGQPNRRLYYITPTGVFLHTDAILDYRAQGTFN